MRCVTSVVYPELYRGSWERKWARYAPSHTALGVDAVLVSPRCADPLPFRSIRVGMGGVFRVPRGQLGDGKQGLAGLRAAVFTLAAMDLTDTARPLDEVDAASAVSMWELRAR